MFLSLCVLCELWACLFVFTCVCAVGVPVLVRVYMCVCVCVCVRACWYVGVNVRVCHTIFASSAWVEGSSLPHPFLPFNARYALCVVPVRVCVGGEGVPCSLNAFPTSLSASSPFPIPPPPLGHVHSRPGLTVVGFCDGFGAWPPECIMATFLPSTTSRGSLDRLWVTCRYVQDSVEGVLAGRGGVVEPCPPITVVGSPTLEQWRTLAPGPPPPDTPDDAAPRPRTVLFVGGCVRCRLGACGCACVPGVFLCCLHVRNWAVLLGHHF
jgi:hypothetical protein